MVESNGLKRKTFTGFFWSFLDLLINLGAQFFILMILARELAPEIFGLTSIVTVLITILNSVIDGGMTEALIRDQEADEHTYSTVFFYTLTVSIGVYAILYFSSPVISSFFQKSELTMITRTLGLGLIITAAGTIPRVKLVKRIHFRSQVLITILALSSSGGAAVYLAKSGFGVWSLIIQSLVLQLVQALMLWILVRWKPIFTFRPFVFKRLFSFGSRVSLTTVMELLFSNSYMLIIGKLYPAGQLGLYSNAVKLWDVITASTSSALQRVSFPILSKMQADEAILLRGLRKILRLSAFILFPIIFGLIAVSESLILFLFGENWGEAVRYFKLLCIPGILVPLQAINMNVLQVKGRSDLILKMQMIKMMLLVVFVSISIVLNLGIMGLIYASILNALCSLIINIRFSARIIGYTVFNQVHDIYSLLLLSAGMGAAVYALGFVLPSASIQCLFLQALAGIVLYTAAGTALNLGEFRQMIRFFKTACLKLSERRPFSHYRHEGKKIEGE